MRVSVGLRATHRGDVAVMEVIVEQADGDFLQGAGRGRDLDDDVGTVGIGLDHPLQSPYLPFDLAEPYQVVDLPGRVPPRHISRRRTLPLLDLRPAVREGALLR